MGHLRSVYLCAGLVLLTLVAYLPLWRNDFVDFDDEGYLTKNPAIQQGLTWSGVTWAWTNDEAPYWFPITWLSFLFDTHFFSTRTSHGQVMLCPAAFHGQNLIWHMANVLLLFGLLHRFGGARWRGFLVAALFAVHPMHVESVAWATQRKDVLSAFFGLVTVWAYVCYLQHPGWRRYLAMAMAFLLSLLAKPMLITLPFVLLLLDYYPLCRFGPATPALATRGVLKRAPFGWLVLEKLPLIALAGVIAGLTLETRDRHSALVSLDLLPLSARLANALTAIGWYLSTTFCPCRLAVLYPHPYRNWSLFPVLAGAASFLFVTALSLWQARRRPWLITGWLWFLGTLSPVLGLAQGGTQAWADRFSYWPHIGLLVVIVWGLAELVERCRIPVVVSSAAWTLALASFVVLTAVQVSYWRDSVTLWEHALAVTVDNDQAHQHLARAYRQCGRLEEAEFHTFESYRLRHKRVFGFPPVTMRSRQVPASRLREHPRRAPRVAAEIPP
jgi:hypothetical protein